MPWPGSPSVKIYPTIEIMDGKAVDRIDGSPEPPGAYPLAPLDAAHRFAAAGASCLHIVDVDGTLSGGRHNAALIRRIIDEVGVPVQVAGGIRTIDSARWWFDHGATRICLGTAAVRDRRLVMEACLAFPDRVLITIAARRGMVVIEGWREETSFAAIDLARGFERSGAAEIVFVDLDRWTDPRAHSLANTMRMGEALGIPVISSGTIETIDDVAMLRYLPNIGGCVIGRALFAGTVDLAEAIATAAVPYTAPSFL